MISYGVIVVVVIGLLDKDPNMFCPPGFKYESGWCLRDQIIDQEVEVSQCQEYQDLGEDGECVDKCTGMYEYN